MGDINITSQIHHDRPTRDNGILATNDAYSVSVGHKLHENKRNIHIVAHRVDGHAFAQIVIPVEHVDELIASLQTLRKRLGLVKPRKAKADG